MSKKPAARKEDERAPEPHATRELFGFGVEKLDGKYLAVKISTHGSIEVLNPLRNGKIEGESRALATARALEQFKHELRSNKR